MPEAALPFDEAERLLSLTRSGLLEGRANRRIKGVTELATRALKRPMAAVSLVTADKQVLRGAIRMPTAPTPRAHSFCAHAILQPDRPLIVENAQEDRRFANYPQVTDPKFRLRFYAGMPLRLPDGHAAGVLCALDQVPGTLSDFQIAILRELAETVEDIFAEQAPAAGERLTLLQELRRAASAGDFTLQWQPIARARDLQVHGHEALVRWTRPGGVPARPDDFIPLAERSGLIGRIDRAVLWAACTEMASLPDERRLSVNVSARWFGLARPRLPGLIAQVLASTGLSPDRLTIELTERVIVDNPDRALWELRDLKAIGVRLALDDFGTGYSSLSYLEAYPFDIVKLDKTFVRGLGANERSEAVVKAVIRLGHDLGMMLCAEGVETERQLEFLRIHDCDLVQGYLLGRPGRIRP